MGLIIKGMGKKKVCTNELENNLLETVDIIIHIPIFILWVSCNQNNRLKMGGIASVIHYHTLPSNSRRKTLFCSMQLYLSQSFSQIQT